jgi:hypothetical protein
MKSNAPKELEIGWPYKKKSNIQKSSCKENNYLIILCTSAIWCFISSNSSMFVTVLWNVGQAFAIYS